MYYKKKYLNYYNVSIISKKQLFSMKHSKDIYGKEKLKQPPYC